MRRRRRIMTRKQRRMRRIRRKNEKKIITEMNEEPDETKTGTIERSMETKQKSAEIDDNKERETEEKE
jgi:hypothetical protein